MHLLQDPTNIVLGTVTDRVCPPNRFQFLDTIEHMDGTWCYHVEKAGDRRIVEDQIYE